MIVKSTAATAAAAAIIFSSSYQSVLGFEYRAPVSQQKHDINRISNTYNNNADINEIAATVITRDDYCLVFEDHFDKFDLKNWQHEISLSGGKITYIILQITCSLQINNRWELGISMVYK
jgi:hypothetical protein